MSELDMFDHDMADGLDELNDEDADRFGEDQAGDEMSDEKNSKQQKPDDSDKDNSEETKEKKDPMLIAIKVLIGLLVVVYFAILLFGKKLLGADNELYRSLNLFGSDKGFEPLKFYRILSLVIMVLTIREILTWIFDKIMDTPELTKKTGAAIIGLFQSAVRYTAVLVLIFMILNTLGMNSTEILASVGILGMIVGLGAESIVADIVAGFFIIIERLYDVGDIITVDNFYGKVIAIGIRSTKIEDKSRNVKVIRNSSIGTLINMTEKETMLPVHLVLDYDVDLLRVEEIIKEALPKMKEKIPDIQEGPNYLGVTNIDGNGIQLRIIAKCTEETRSRVKRKMLREFKLLFDEHNISWGWNNYLKQSE